MLRGIAVAAALWWSAPGALASQVTPLEGHGGPVMAAAVQGATALTASFDNSVGHWDLDSGAVRWLEGHKAAVKSVIAVPGDRAASAGDDFSVIIWDLAAAKPLHVLEGHHGSVAALAVSADGAHLASAGWDGRIGLWRLADGSLVGWLAGHDGAVNDVAFGENVLFSASADGTVRSWDLDTLRERRVEVRHGFAVNVLLTDPAAGWLAYGAVDGGTRVVDPATGAVLADLTLERRPILALARSPSGERIAVGDGQGHVMVVETADWSIVGDYQVAARGPIWALAYAGKARLLVGGIDDTAYALPEAGAGRVVIGADPRGFLADPDTMENGERQFKRKCSVCHTLSGDGGRRAGPPLAGIFGRPAGAVPGYGYSATLTDSDIVWSEETLDALFALGPEHYVPGSHMPMQRITSAADRRDLIDYLRRNATQ